MQGEPGLDGLLRRIEEIVAALDSDALDLDQALTLFEEGVAHLASAREILVRTELRVEELIGADGDEIRTMELAGGEATDGPGDG